MTKKKALLRAAMNILRNDWVLSDGEGAEGDYEGWRLFDLKPNEAFLAIDLTTANFKKADNKDSDEIIIFPRRVRLSDAAFIRLL